jgi:hypothetical protein
VTSTVFDEHPQAKASESNETATGLRMVASLFSFVMARGSL